MDEEMPLFPDPIDVSLLTFDDLPVGTRVKVVTGCVDFHFFRGDTGTVIENRGTYLGIIVKFDRVRYFQGFSGLYSQESFNFNPENLEII